MKKNDLVIPSQEGRRKLKFNKNAEATFPWKVKRVEGLRVWIQHSTKKGNLRTETYHINFWEVTT